MISEAFADRERYHRAGGRGMARRVGLGPVFAFEWLMASRRWQAYAMRSLTVLLLLGAMAPVWYAGPTSAGELSIPSRRRSARSSTP